MTGRTIDDGPLSDELRRELDDLTAELLQDAETLQSDAGDRSPETTATASDPAAAVSEPPAEPSAHSEHPTEAKNAATAPHARAHGASGGLRASRKRLEDWRELDELLALAEGALHDLETGDPRTHAGEAARWREWTARVARAQFSAERFRRRPPRRITKRAFVAPQKNGAGLGREPARRRDEATAAIMARIVAGAQARSLRDAATSRPAEAATEPTPSDAAAVSEHASDLDDFRRLLNALGEDRRGLAPTRPAAKATAKLDAAPERRRVEETPPPANAPAPEAATEDRTDPPAAEATPSEAVEPAQSTPPDEPAEPAPVEPSAAAEKTATQETAKEDEAIDAALEQVITKEVSARSKQVLGKVAAMMAAEGLRRATSGDAPPGREPDPRVKRMIGLDESTPMVQRRRPPLPVEIVDEDDDGASIPLDAPPPTPSDDGAPPQAAAEPPPPTALTDPGEPAPPVDPSGVAQPRSDAPGSEDGADLMSRATQQATSEMFRMLSDHAVAEQLRAKMRADGAMSPEAIEDAAQNALRPMLSNWMENHLVEMVERLIREEIEKVSGRK